MHIIQECRVICYIELFFIDFSKVFRLQSLFICFNCNVYRSWTSTIKYIADQWTSQVGFHPAKNGGYLRSVVEVRAAAAVAGRAATASESFIAFRRDDAIRKMNGNFRMRSSLHEFHLPSIPSAISKPPMIFYPTTSRILPPFTTSGSCHSWTLCHFYQVPLSSATVLMFCHVQSLFANLAINRKNLLKLEPTVGI